MRRWLAFGIGSSSLVSARWRRPLLQMCGVKTKHVRMEHGAVLVGSPSQLSIGRGTFINVGAGFFAKGGIHIGSQVRFGPRVTVLTGTHDLGDSSLRAGPVKFLPVEIGDGAWIGACVTINPGVKIGEGCVVASGSVVTSDCEPNALYAGVPARRMKSLE